MSEVDQYAGHLRYGIGLSGLAHIEFRAEQAALDPDAFIRKVREAIRPLALEAVRRKVEEIREETPSEAADREARKVTREALEWTGAPLEPGKFYAYAYLDEDMRPLYVGYSKNPKKRNAQHSRIAPWYCQASQLELFALDTREEALAAESYLIQTWRPAHNKAGVVRCG